MYSGEHLGTVFEKQKQAYLNVQLVKICVHR